VDFNPDGLEDAVGEAKARGPAPKRDRFERSGRGGGRGERGGGRDRERGPRRDDEATEAVRLPADMPNAAPTVLEVEPEAIRERPERSERPRRERGASRPEKTAEAAGERPVAREDAPRPRDRDGGRKPPQDIRARREKPDSEDQGGPRTKGMGDHVPAFLQRQLKPREDA
jgi:hypothetical protein